MRNYYELCFNKQGNSMKIQSNFKVALKEAGNQSNAQYSTTMIMVIDANGNKKNLILKWLFTEKEIKAIEVIIRDPEHKFNSVYEKSVAVAKYLNQYTDTEVVNAIFETTAYLKHLTDNTKSITDYTLQYELPTTNRGISIAKTVTKKEKTAPTSKAKNNSTKNIHTKNQNVMENSTRVLVQDQTIDGKTFKKGTQFVIEGIKYCKMVIKIGKKTVSANLNIVKEHNSIPATV